MARTPSPRGIGLVAAVVTAACAVIELFLRLVK
jgi:hypothetical protein